MTASEQLLSDVKNWLDITWDDEAMDRKTSEAIKSGMAYIRRIGGGVCNFYKEGPHRQLLFEYCRYARSNALERFGRNFQPELLALQMDRLVMQDG